MKQLLTLTLLGCLAALGCKSGASAPQTTGGAPAAVLTSKKKSDRPPAPPSFDVIPNRVELKKGEKKKSTINVERKGGFAGEIKLEFDTSDIPGIKIADTTVPSSPDEKQDIEIEVAAEATAKPKTGRVQVTATAMGFDPKPQQFEVMISK